MSYEDEDFFRQVVPFGRGTVMGALATHEAIRKMNTVDAFFEAPMLVQAKTYGWANGCPVVDELTNPDNAAPGRGPKNMLRRYGEVNFWFGHIVRELVETNVELALRLTTRVRRQDDEPPIKYESNSIPMLHYGWMAPMGTLPGYALPRMFVEQLRPEGGAQDEMPQRMAKGLGVVRSAGADSTDLNEFMARTAEGLAHADAAPLKLLKHMLGQGWMDEHNAQGMVDSAKQALEENAPSLWNVYDSLTPEEKAEQRFV